MKFSDTMLYTTLMFPIEEWSKSCVYIWLLKIPMFITTYTFGIILAIVIDFIVAMKG